MAFAMKTHDTEVPAKARRRRFAAEYKQRILREVERCTNTPQKGALHASRSTLNSMKTCLKVIDALRNTLLGDQPSTDPQLGPIADNSGPTQTNAPLPSSSAIDRGGDSGCPIRDQRGIPRPLDGNGDNIAICDIGAVEVPEPVFGMSLWTAAAVLARLSRNRPFRRRLPSSHAVSPRQSRVSGTIS